MVFAWVLSHPFVGDRDSGLDGKLRSLLNRIHFASISSQLIDTPDYEAFCLNGT
jgi:hypothetical protein